MKTINNEEVFDFRTASAWEKWLESHHQKSGGVWLRIAKKNSGETSVTITEALDLALCYGWIDSQRKGLDEKYYLQRYSPRRSKSPWSQINIEKTKILIKEDRMQPAGFQEIEKAKKDGRWNP